MDKNLNIGIIGAGVVAERFIRSAMAHSRACIKGIYDNDQDRLLTINRKYWIEGYSSYHKLLEDDSIDIIYLAVPPKFHYPIGIDIFKSGKHFICEKPLANSTEEARKMAELAKDSNLVYAMNFPTIYVSAYEKIKQLLEEHFVGNVVRVEFQGYFSDWPRPWQKNPWISTREQGGFTREVVTHYIQLMQRLFGDLEDVNSFVNYPTDTYRSEKSLIAKANIKDIEVLINCVTDIGIKENLSFNIIGSSGSIQLRDWREIWVSQKDEDLHRLELPEVDSIYNLIEEVFKAIDGEKGDLVDFNEGYSTHIVIEKLLGNM